MSKTGMNVLVPLHTSGRGEEALEPAADLATRNGGKVTVVVANDASGERSLQQFASAEGITGGEALDRYMEQVERRLRRQSVELEVISTPKSSAIDGVADYAERNDVSVIAVTEPRRPTIKERVLGTPADRIVRSSQVPVFVIPEAA